MQINKLEDDIYVLNVFHNSGHTTSTLGVDIPDADLLIVGDTLVGNIVYLAYSTPERFVPALDLLQSRARKRLLSSHGNVRDNAAISNAQHYLKSFRQLTSEALAATDREQSILELPIEACLPPGVDPTSFERMFHERNLHQFLERKQ
jgi:glyoxylase-like metal-dependent hydrolase (beta-lactamase superfamily II)